MLEAWLNLVCRKSLRRFCIFFAVALANLSSGSAWAITIDELVSANSSPVTVDSTQPLSTRYDTSSQAYGGGRALRAIWGSGPNALSIKMLSGTFTHSQDFGVKGQSALVWDGSGNASTDPLIPSLALVPVDLTEDGGTGIRITGFASDHAGQLTVLLFESSTKASQAVISFAITAVPTDIDIPFSSFVAQPGKSAANPAAIRAMSLIINGTVEQDLDLQIQKIGTDGLCTHVPVNGLVLDLCGECNGDNSSCSDCKGVPHGTALPGSPCDTGDVGVCKDGTYSGTPPTSCSCDQITPSGPETCDGLDNDCDGQIDEIIDACGVCGGDGSSCAGCDGVPKSGKVVDKCGICGGDGRSCDEDCQVVEQSEVNFALDAAAKHQEKDIRKAVRLINQTSVSQSLKKEIDEILVRAHSLQIRNWIISWTIPQIFTTCPNQVVCVVKSNEGLLNEYRTHASELLTLNNTVAELLIKKRLPGRARIIKRAGLKIYNDSIALAATVPTSTQVCTNRS